METIDKIESLLRHIQMVQNNCFLLAKRLLKEGKEELALELIKNGLQHDASKFESFEFKNLWSGEDKFNEALRQHQITNEHHPEYWNSIHEMPDVYLAEMVCDVTARAQEFGTDVQYWMEMFGTKKYNFNMEDPVAEKIFGYFHLLLTKKFQ